MLLYGHTFFRRNVSDYVSIIRSVILYSWLRGNYYSIKISTLSFENENQNKLHSVPFLCICIDLTDDDKFSPTSDRI
jgi:hypothetical protein